MPLPDSNIQWPPKDLQTITAKLSEWDAWYSGDPHALGAAYGTEQPISFHRAQYRGGLVGSVARWFWGPPPNQSEDRIRLHVPIASDICQASSDLLFADPPTITDDDKAANERIQQYLDDGLITRLATAAEVCAALGGVFLRVSWDATVSDRPFTTTIDADAAYPEFTWGRLSALTAWWKWSENSTVYRQLERHELDPAGIGVIEHALYRGTGDDLGVRVPLAEHTRTRALAPLVNEFSQITTGTPGLAVTYVPNLPGRRWRNDPLGTNLGRSDLDGIEPLMDALDRTYSSWMRDIELGKGRVIVPDYMLEVNGPGKGVTFDLDREVFTGLAAAPNADKFDLQIAQFAIRVEEHRQTAQQLMEDILRSAGYSAQTFGEDETGGSATATEVTSRDRRSALTRDRKIRSWQPAIREHIAKLLAVDRVILNAALTENVAVTVAFNDSAQDTPLQLATTAEMLLRAQAASTWTRVQLVHPDWTETQVQDEVDLINGDTALADPAEIGAGGFGLTGSAPGDTVA